MNFIPLLFYSLAFFLLAAYVITIILATSGLKKTSTKGQFYANQPLTPDIIIAYHNEAHNLTALINDLLEQTHQNFRVIWVNDNSTDSSESIIKTKGTQLNSIHVKNINSGKKQAIQTAIKHANAPLWIFTDADCRLGNTWISDYIGYYQNNGSGLYFGPVVYKVDRWLEKLFALEFLSIMGTGMGLAKCRLSVYMNGANYAVTSDLGVAYSKQEGKGYASGDDVFLLHAIKKHYGGHKIFACTDHRMTVETNAPNSVRAFLYQRMRWGSKTPAYKDLHTKSLAVLVLLVAASQLTAFAFMQYWVAFGLLWLIKSATDYFALHNYSSRWDKKQWMNLFIILAILYPIYLLFTAIASVFSSTKKWLK